jgi:hypothetical protein
MAPWPAPATRRAECFSRLQSPCLPLSAEKFTRCENLQIIDGLSKEGAEIPAIEREQHIGTGECGAKDRPVLRHSEK